MARTGGFNLFFSLQLTEQHKTTLGFKNYLNRRKFERNKYTQLESLYYVAFLKFTFFCIFKAQPILTEHLLYVYSTLMKCGPRVEKHWSFENQYLKIQRKVI